MIKMKKNMKDICVLIFFLNTVLAKWSEMDKQNGRTTSKTNDSTKTANHKKYQHY